MPGWCSTKSTTSTESSIPGGFAISPSSASTTRCFPERLWSTNSDRARSGRVENDDAASVLALIQIRKSPRRLVNGIGARDQLIQLEPAAAVQAYQSRKIQLRTGRPVVA